MWQIWSFIHVEDNLEAAARAGAPLRRAPGGAEAPAGGCASDAGRGLGVACASAFGRGLVGGGRRPRIPFEGNSKGILELPSKGVRRELVYRVIKVLRVVSGTSCNHHLALPRIGCAFPFQRPLKEFEEAWTATSAFTSAEASHGLPLTTLTTQGVLRILDNNDGFKPSTP